MGRVHPLAGRPTSPWGLHLSTTSRSLNTWRADEPRRPAITLLSTHPTMLTCQQPTSQILRDVSPAMASQSTKLSVKYEGPRCLAVSVSSLWNVDGKANGAESVFHVDAFQTSQVIRARENAVLASRCGGCLEGSPHSSRAFVPELCHRYLCQGK